MDCPRRFELRYILRQAWPAIRSEPVLEHERHMLRGELFHRMIQQHQLGLPAEQVAAQAREPILLEWWQNYLSYAPRALPDQRYPEIALQSSLNSAAFIAKLDLLAVEPGQRCLIVDWKTGQKKPSRANLRARIQTRLYPWMVVQAGQTFQNSIPVRPDQVEMIYWFTADPQHPEIFKYSPEQYRSDAERLQQLVQQVEGCLQNGFELTTDEKKCAFCNYRSLCERGSSAGTQDSDIALEAEQEPGFDLDFDQIEPIAF